MTTFPWPAALKPRDFGYFFLDADQSGGTALGGGEQVVFSPGPRWGAAMTLPVRNKEQLLAIRALRVNLRGRANPIALPNFDGKRLSWPQRFTASFEPTGFILKPNNTRDRSLDGTIYEAPEIPDESEISAETVGISAARATTISIRVTQGEPMLAGQQFGIAGRLYEIGSLELGEGAGGEGNPYYNVTFLPPMRSAIAAGTTVKFTRPTCLMRCVNLNDELTKLEALTFATLNLEFVEYL